MKIDESYWLRRWKEGDTGWHQDAPEEALIQYFGDLKPTRVFVPLCGKSLDLLWLASRGHEVVGVELSELAVEAFFREQGLKFKAYPSGPYKRYETSGGGPKISILQGDFFDLKPKSIAPFGALYDRGSLGALPLDLRARYIAQIKMLVKESGAGHEFRFLQLVIERIPHDDTGPPFSISEAMLRSFYEDTFTIDLLEREDAELEHASGSRSDHCIYRLTPR